MIKIDNLNKYFFKNKVNEIHVINNTTISFNNTGLVTILGESGSGKTTLLNVIGGLDSFDSGSIMYDDTTINKYNYKEITKIRNKKIGYVFQNYLLLNNHTVYDNLKIVLDMFSLDDKEKEKRIDDVLIKVNMLKYKRKMVNELSGGQKQRIAIARALIKSPLLILADEPTGNLDEKNTIMIMNLLKKISKHTLVIMVSHETKIANSFSDYIIKIKDGEIVKYGNNELDEYEYEQDLNIYLNDLSYKGIENENVKLNIYGNENKKVELTIVFNNNKIYLKSNENFSLLNDDSEVKLIDASKEKLILKENNSDEELLLDKLEYKNNNLSFKEELKVANNNVKSKNKNTIFIKIAMFLIAIFSLLSLQSIKIANNIDIKNLTTSNSRVVTLNLNKGSDTSILDYSSYYEALYDDINGHFANRIDIVTTIDSLNLFSYSLNSFEQLRNKEYKFSGFDVLPLEYVKNEDIIYGRMPSLPNEIVVDTWVLENVLKDSTLANFMDVYSFLNQQITYKYNSLKDFKIVGICKKNANSIYIDKFALLSILPSSLRKNNQFLCPFSKFKEYNKEYENFILDENTALVNVSYQTDGKQITLNNDKQLTFNVLEIKDDNMPFNIVISDILYEKVKRSVLKYDSKIMYFYCQTDALKNELYEYINNIQEKYFETFRFEYSCKYDMVIEPYLQEAKKTTLSRSLIVITILSACFFIIYFLMKSYVSKQIKTIGTYLAIGINKVSLTITNLLEIIKISLIPLLLGIFIPTIILNFISSIPIIDFDFYIDLSLSFVNLFALLLLTMLIGIIPLQLYLRLTPSVLLSKYDI